MEKSLTSLSNPSKDFRWLRSEKFWTAQSAERCLSPEEYFEWMAAKCPHRLLAYVGKLLFLWKLEAGQPKFVDTLEVCDVFADPDKGLECLCINEADEEVWLSHTPKRLASGLFAWLPHYNDVQYAEREHDSGFRLLFSVMCQMAEHPGKGVEGPVYLSDYGSFKDLWPSLDPEAMA